MANKVNFLLGLQSSVDAYLKTPSNDIKAGAFYLTKDTHRLYFGVEAGTDAKGVAHTTNWLAALNQGIISVPNYNALPSLTDKEDLYAGNFYYLEDSNILCIASSGNNGPEWVQINPDTMVTKVEITGADGDNASTLTLNLETSQGRGITLTSTFTIAGEGNVDVRYENNKTIITGGNASISATQNGTNIADVKIANSVSGANNKIQIKGDGVAVDVDNNGVITLGVDLSEEISSGVIESFTTAVNNSTADNTAVVSYNLKEGSASFTPSFEIAGDGTTTSVSANNGKVLVTANNYDLSTAQNGNKAKISLAGNLDTTPDVVNLVPGTNVESISVSGDDITINTYDDYVSAVTHSANIGDGFTTVITRAGGADSKAVSSNVLDPIISIGHAADKKQDVHFVGGKAVLPVYTATEIDDKLAEQKRTLNAMTYKGTVESASELPTTGVSIGDTYLVSGPFGGYEKGSLLIAQGTESNSGDGYIVSGLTWDYVEADVELYELLFTDGSGNTNVSFTLNDKEGGKGTRGTVVFEDGSNTNVSASKSGDTLTVKYNHNVLAVNETAGQALSLAAATKDGNGTLSFNIANGITYDAYGHIKGFTTQNVTVLDTHNKIDTITVNDSLTSSVWKQSLSITDIDGNISSCTDIKTVAVDTANTNLKIDTTNQYITLEWGSF